MTGLLAEVYSFSWVPVWVWIVLGVAGWVAAAWVTALFVGRMARLRDAQTPRPPQRPADEELAAHERYAHDEARDN